MRQGQQEYITFLLKLKVRSLLFLQLLTQHIKSPQELPEILIAVLLERYGQMSLGQFLRIIRYLAESPDQGYIEPDHKGKRRQEHHGERYVSYRQSGLTGL